MKHCPNCGAKFENPEEQEPTCAFCGTHLNADQTAKQDAPMPQVSAKSTDEPKVVPLSPEGKKLVSLINLAQAAGNNKEIYTLANQLIQQDIDSPEGYYYKAISTGNVKEGWVLWEKLKSMNPSNAIYYIEAATNLGGIYVGEYRSEVSSIKRWIQHGEEFADKVDNAWDECESHWPKFADNAIWSLDGYAKCIQFLDPILKIENKENSLLFSEEEREKAKQVAKNLIARMMEGISFLSEGVSTGILSSISCSGTQTAKLEALQAKYQNYFGDGPVRPEKKKKEKKKGGCFKWILIIIVIIIILAIIGNMA